MDNLTQFLDTLGAPLDRGPDQPEEHLSLSLPRPVVGQAVPSQLESRDALSSLPPATTDDLLIDLWLHGRSPETKRAYRADIALFRQFVRGAEIRAVTLIDLQAFADSLSFLSPASQARRLKAVKSLYSFALKVGYLPINVATALRVPSVDDQLAERILTEEQVMRMLALEKSPRNHALLRLLYAAGLRVTEACLLTWQQLIPRDTRGQVRVLGKGMKTRNILLSSQTWEELIALRSGAQSSSPVFVSRGGNGVKKGAALTARQVRQIVAAAAKRAGIDGNVSPHWLRHAHASHALDRGAPPHLVRETLGHASLITTSRYTHARPTQSSSEYLTV